MKKNIFSIFIVLAALVIIVSFFRSWAKVTTSSFVDTAEKIANIFGQKLPNVDIKMTVTGYSIPQMANSQNSKAALAVIETLSKSSKGLGAKSYLVYLLPLSAIACIALALAGLKKKVFIIGMSVLSGLIGGVGLFNLSTVNTDTLITKITIGSGLWNTMYAFLFIFLIGVTWLVLDKNSEIK